MTWQLVQTSPVVTQSSSGTLTCTLPGASTAGNLLVLKTSTGGSSGAPTGVTSGFTSRVSAIQTGTPATRSDIFDYINNPGGVSSASVTLAQSGAAVLTEWTWSTAVPGSNVSADQTGSINAASISSPVNVATSGTLTADHELASSAISVRYSSSTNTTLSAGTGFTQDGAFNNGAKSFTHCSFDYETDTGTSTGATVTDAVTISVTGAGASAGCIVTYAYTGGGTTSGTGTLTGSGTLGASPALAATAALSGLGTLAGPVTAAPAVPVFTGACAASVTVTDPTQPGDAIVVITDAASVPSAVSDSQGNTYVRVGNDTANANSVWVATYKGSPGTPTAALAAGTDTVSTGITTGGMIIARVPGVAAVAVDAAPAFIHSTTAAPSGPATGTLPQSGDIVLYALCGGGSVSVSSWGTGLAQVAAQSVAGAGMALAAEIDASTSSVTPSATLATSQAVTAFTVALAPAAGAVTGTAALSGSGTLGGSAQLAETAALSGQGSLSAAPAVAGAATLTGSGSLAASPVLASASALSGSGSLSAHEIQGAQAGLSGTGTLSASQQAAGAAALSGSGALSAAPVLALTANLSGSGVLGTAARFSASAGLTGLGTLSAAPVRAAVASMTGTGTLSAAPTATQAGSAALSGTGTLSAAYTGVTTAPLSGAGSLTAAPALAAAPGLSGTGQLRAAGLLAGAVSLSGTGALASSPAYAATAALSGTGHLGTAPARVAGAALSGSGTLSGGYLVINTVTLSGSGTLSPAYQLAWAAVALLAGTGTLTGDRRVTSSGNTGVVIWTAWAAPSRWGTAPSAPRWGSQAAPSRWHITLALARWHTAPAPARWRITMTTFDPIAAVSLEYINASWTADLDGTTIDPIAGGLTVQFALPPSSGVLARPAQPVTWYPGVWLAGGTGKGFTAQFLVGPTATVQLTAGQSYDVWSRILGTPEQPAKFVGVQPVY